MTKKLPGNTRQSGIALVIALLLLLVLTILGVASMSGSLMQERMAGNVNLQALAFEAASAGVARSWEFGYGEDKVWPEDATCQRGSGSWPELPDPSDWVDLAVDGLPDDITVQYRQRVGCFQPDEIPEDWVVAAADGFLFPVQLLVLNQGRVIRTSDEEVLALREIEVRIENRGGDDACALRIEGKLDNIDIKGGGPEVDGGEGGCSVSVTENAQALIDEIGDNHIGNYTPPPKEDDGVEPWNDPGQFAELVNQMKTAVLAYKDFSDPDVSGSSGTWSTQEKWVCHLWHRADRPDLKGDSVLPIGCGADGWDDGWGVHNYPDEEEDNLELRSMLGRIFDFAVDRVGQTINDASWSIENCESRFFDGNTRIGTTGNIPRGQCHIEGNSSPDWEHTGVDVGRQPPDPTQQPFITYIAGHLGNPANNSGNGIVIIEGGNCWSGTADFQGLQLILGGHYEIIGGGGGETEGSIVLTKLEDRYGEGDVSFNPKIDGEDPRDEIYPAADEGYFDDSGLVFAGGGNHKISFKCGGDGDEIGLADYIDQINACLGTNHEPNCDPDGAGMRPAIASWREYVDRVRWPLDDD